MFTERKQYDGDRVLFINEAENIIIEPFGENRNNVHIVTCETGELCEGADTIELADISQKDISQAFQIVYTFSADEFKKLAKEVESFVEKHKIVKV